MSEMQSMTKAETIEFAKANGACKDFIRRFEKNEPLEYDDLRWAIEYNLDLGYEVYLRAVKENGWALRHVPKELRTHEICMEAVKKYGSALRYVPKSLRIHEIYLAAVKKNGLVLEFVPEEHKTHELCFEAVKQNNWAIKFVPEKYRHQINKELN